MSYKMKVLVTGGVGFIGSEVVKQLLEKGYDVKVADNLSKSESSVKEGYEFVKVDLTEKDKTIDAFKDVDVCINMAAKIGGIGYFHKYPATILSENNKIYSNTFDAAVKNNIKRMIYISSSMVFESTDKFPSKEEHVEKIPPPKTSYGFSKLSGEWYCRAYKEEYGLNYSICRPFNAYGINEFPREEIGYAHVIPDLIKKILSGQYPLELLGDGQQTRCFTHVKDIANGIITVMESKRAVNEAFNVSSPREVKMIDGVYESPYSDLDSPFNHLAENVFAQYLAKGIKVDDMSYTKEQRDATPCQYRANDNEGGLNDFAHPEDWVMVNF